MKKIIIVIGGFMSEGGCERALINLLNYLKPPIYKVDLLIFSNRGYQFNLIPDYINVLPFLDELDFYSDELLEQYQKEGKTQIADIRKMIHEKYKDQKDLAFYWEIIKQALPQHEGYDIAISYNMGTPMRYIVDRVKAKKKVAWIHFDYMSAFTPPAQSAIMVREYVKKLDKIICVTEENKKAFLLKCDTANEKKVIVLPNITDYEDIEKKSTAFYPKEYQHDTFNIFTASRITFDKGIDTLIETANILKEKHIEFKWFVAGQKSKGYEKYENKIKLNNLNNNIKLLGFKKNPFPYYRYCDLYVQPSPYEGKSMAVDEAKVLGCPIVLYNYPSASDSIKQGINGLIAGNSAETLAEGIITMYMDSRLRKKFTKFLLNEERESTYAQYDNFFEKILGEQI